MPVLVLALSVSSSAADRPALDPFAEIQGQYFSMLNLRAGAKRLAPIPAFAAKLTALAEAEKAKFASGALTKPGERERAGLILIYDALLTVNGTNGALQKTLKFSDLRAAHAFGPSSASDHEEAVARAQHVIEDDELAAKLRPEDHRIDSWLAAAKIGKERIQAGEISQQALIDSLDAIPVRPTFNLWTSFMLLKDQPADSKLFARLAGEAKGFVDKMKTGDNPCAKRPEDCENGPKAPYNLQASITELGDVFLRRAESLLKAGDVPHAMEMAGYAKGSYASLDKPEHAADTKAWPDAFALVDRLARVEAIQHGHVAKPLLARTDNYRRPYECASCHGR